VTTARYSNSIENLDVGSTLAASDAIIYGDFERGMVHIPSGSSLTTLTWYSSISEAGVYLAAYTESNSAITTTVAAGRSYPIPEALAGARFLKITGNAAGVVGVTLKD
jgi:hypothetical protein